MSGEERMTKEKDIFPLNISPEFDEDEIIVGFCEGCGAPVTNKEVLEHHYSKGKMIIERCVYCGD